MSKNNQNAKTVNFQNLNEDGSFKEVAGILLESTLLGSSEGKHGKCYTTDFKLKTDGDINVPDIVSVVKRNFNEMDEIINYRLFYNPNKINEKIKLSEIIIKHLDDYETIWKNQFSPFLEGHKTIIYDPIINLHLCFELERDGFKDKILIFVATLQDKIIGYMVSNEDCEAYDLMTFLFKNKETCSDVIFDFMKNTLVSVLDGGREVNFRDIFTFTDDEIKDYISDKNFVVNDQRIFQAQTTLPINSDIDNSLGIN